MASIRSWVRRLVGHEDLAEDLHHLRRTLEGIDERLSVLQDQMAKRQDLEADAVDRLRRLQDAVDEGRVDPESGLVSDLNLGDFDPNLGV